MDIDTIIGFIGSFVIFLSLLFAYVFRKDRRKKLRKIACDVHCTFSEAKPTDSLPSFTLFSQGDSKAIHNVLYRTIDDVKITVFDYQYTVGSGKNSNTYRQTVFWARSPSLKLPSFTLRPEGRLHGLAELFGAQDIDFETHPAFSKHFLLQGKEPALRQFFSPLLLEYYKQHEQRFTTETKRRQFILYRNSKLVEPDQMERFFEDGRELIELYRLGLKSRGDVLLALKDEEAQVRAEAARAVGLFRDPTMVSLLLPLLKDPHPQVRQGTVWALGLLSVVRVMPSIVEALKDSSESIRHEAETTLRKMCPLVQTVVFGQLSSEQIEHPPYTVWNLDVSNLSIPMNALNRVIIDVNTHDFYQVERFLTYAVNALGQKYLKKHLVVQVIGDQKNLHANLRNILTNLCKHVHISEHIDENNAYDRE